MAQDAPDVAEREGGGVGACERSVRQGAQCRERLAAHDVLTARPGAQGQSLRVAHEGVQRRVVEPLDASGQMADGAPPGGGVVVTVVVVVCGGAAAFRVQAALEVASDSCVRRDLRADHRRERRSLLKQREKKAERPTPPRTQRGVFWE